MSESSQLLLEPVTSSVAVAQRGGSLTELMVALTAGVLIVGSTLSMTVQHARLRKADEELCLALAACRNSLEELRSLPLPTLQTMDGVDFDVPGSNGQPGGLGPAAGDPDGLPGEFSVTADQTAGTETVYLVRATATWSGSLGRQSLALETLMGARE